MPQNNRLMPFFKNKKGSKCIYCTFSTTYGYVKKKPKPTEFKDDLKSCWVKKLYKNIVNALFI